MIVETMEVLLQRVAFQLRVAPMAFQNGVVTSPKGMSSRSGWFLELPKIVNAGNPVLHQRAQQVEPSEIKSQKVQNIIDNMIRVMRNAPGVGLAAPQIGIPLRIIVLEDKKEYMGYDAKEEIKAQDRRPFDLLFS